MTDINAIRAASAYRNQLKMMEGADISADAESALDKPSFSDMLGDALSGAVDTQYKTEEVKIGAIMGGNTLTDLVTAVSEADLTLNTVVSIRDKMIAAYQDILRMPI